jgi:predicted acetyltransferase
MFKFLEPGRLVDAELELLLSYKYQGDEPRGWVPSYRFNMALTSKSTEAGNIELRIGNIPHILLYAGHIGYRVHPPYRGHHYAARACKLLVPLAKRHGLQTLWITCNPDNLASRRTCELAGATFVEIVDLPPDTDMYREGERQKCRYRLDI